MTLIGQYFQLPFELLLVYLVYMNKNDLDWIKNVDLDIEDYLTFIKDKTEYIVESRDPWTSRRYGWDFIITKEYDNKGGYYTLVYIDDEENPTVDMVIENLEVTIAELTFKLGPSVIKHSDRYRHLMNLLTITKEL